MAHPLNRALVLNRCANPDVRRYAAIHKQIVVPLAETRGTSWAFREHLVYVALRGEHHLKDLADELLGDVVVKQVGHRVDEHHPWCCPASGLFQAIGPQPDGERIVSIVGSIYSRRLCKVDVAQPAAGKHWAHPVLTLVQPVTGFQVASVHCMPVRSPMRPPW